MVICMSWNVAFLFAECGKCAYISLRLRRGPQLMSWTGAELLTRGPPKRLGSHPAFLLACSGGCSVCACGCWRPCGPTGRGDQRDFVAAFDHWREPIQPHSQRARQHRSTTMLRVSTAALPLSHASTDGGLGRPAALAGRRSPGRGSAKAGNELQEAVGRSQRQALGQSARGASPEVAPNDGKKIRQNCIFACFVTTISNLANCKRSYPSNQPCLIDCDTGPDDKMKIFRIFFLEKRQFLSDPLSRVPWVSGDHLTPHN